jgi:hypothetical protein
MSDAKEARRVHTHLIAPRTNQQIIDDAVRALRLEDALELKDILKVFSEDDEVTKKKLLEILDMCIESGSVSNSIRDFHESNN